MADRSRPQALSIRQPWAWAIIEAEKRIENRNWRPPGHLLGKRLLIHASKGCGVQEYQDAVESIRVASCGAAKPPPLENLSRGGIVGVVRVARGWINPDGSTVGGYVVPPQAMRWHIRGQYGWIFSAVAPLDYVWCAGQLKLWDVPDAIWNRVRTSVGSMVGL